MPNGVMNGEGTRDDPFIVMDGWDFNSLRNVQATSIATVAFVEFGADISLGMFPNFTPIPNRFFNLDGKGHKITNVSMAVSGSAFGLSIGLFQSLTSTEYVRNITVEGITSLLVTGTGSGTVGLLASNLRASGAAGNNVVFENIEVYGSIDADSRGTSTSAIAVGGLAGQVNVEGNVRATIRNCFFRGVIQGAISNTVTSTGVILVIGGLVGRVDLSFSAVASFYLCVSDVNIRMAGANGVRMGVVGGICGDCSGPTNSSTPNRAIAFISSIGRLNIGFNNTGEFNRPLIFSGIMGRNDTSTASSMGAGMTTDVLNCGGFLNINYNPTVSPMGVLDFNGLHGQGVRIGAVTSSYAVIKYNNPNNRELSANFNIHGLGHVNASVNTFFDLTALRETWDGAVSQLAFGRTTEELQSQEFLENQGWVFADV